MNRIVSSANSFAGLIANAEKVAVPEVRPEREPQRVTSQVRQHLLRRIGVFEKIDGEYVGHIATLHFNCKAIIKDNPYRTCDAEPQYIVEQQGAEVFHPELGYAWDKMTDGNHVPYITVHLDDPSFSKTIVGALIKGYKNTYNLFWDRVTISDEDIETQFVSEELKPYIGVYRPIDKVTEYLISIYPSLQEIWDPD